MFVFYNVPKTVPRILGLRPNVFLYLILSVFLAFTSKLAEKYCCLYQLKITYLV